MQRLLIALAFMAGLGLVATPVAHAQTVGVKKTKGYKKKKVFIFKGDEVWGAILKPSGTFITAAKQPHHRSLIEYRLDFQPEMLKLTEEL